MYRIQVTRIAPPAGTEKPFTTAPQNVVGIKPSR